MSEEFAYPEVELATDQPEWALRGQRVVVGDTIRPAAIHIRHGVIAKVADYADIPAGMPVREAGNLTVMPGLCDSHVHINEPGRTDWEGFETATRAAAAGGVTSLLDMPLNSIPPTTTVAGFAAKAAAAQGKLWVDVGLCGGVVPGNFDELRPLIDAGVLAFKCFLTDSGVPEFGHVGEADLAAALPLLGNHGRALLCHAELSGPLDAAARVFMDADPRRYATYLASRPKTAEERAVELVIRQCEKTGGRAHIVHLSAASAVPLLRAARDRGAALSVETCPHYLSLVAEDVPDGGTEWKCAPPIRDRKNQDDLWDALRQGLIDQVVSDHSPSPPSLKCGGDFQSAWGGIASLQLELPVVWTEAAARGRTLPEVCRWMCEMPAQLLHLSDRKGRIAPGCDADLVLFDPEASFVVRPERLHHRHKLTPYARHALRGVVVSTLVRGQCVYHRGEHRAAATGRLLTRGS
jgi:allantoinase